MLYFVATGIPDVGELMIPCFPMDAHFTDTISFENAWYNFFEIFFSFLVLICYHNKIGG